MMNSRFRTWARWLRDVALMALLIFGTRSVVADWNRIPSGSMEPTLLVGDFIFVNRIAYDLKVPFTTWHLTQWDNPHRGDIVVFDSPADSRLLVKRVIGVPGDRIAMHHNQLLINGQPVHYGQPDADWQAELPTQERNNYALATEELPGRPHAVMVSTVSSPFSNIRAVTVPAGKYLMLGDNRDNSADSRFFGFVPRGNIKGRAVRVILSLNPEHDYLPRHHRFLAKLH